MSHSRLFATLAAAIALSLVTSAVFASEMARKWRLEFDGSAHSSGTIVLKVTPEGSDPIVVEAQVADGSRENLVAKAVTEAFRAALPKERFKVDRRDGEDVKIRAHGDAPAFFLELVSSNVQNVRIAVGPIPERVIGR